jgi:hypothetical protein
MRIQIQRVSLTVLGICIGAGAAFIFTKSMFELPDPYIVRGIVTSTPIEPLAIQVHHPAKLISDTPHPVRINKKTTFFRSTHSYNQYGIITRMNTNLIPPPAIILPGTPLMVTEVTGEYPALTVVLFERIKE